MSSFLPLLSAGHRALVCFFHRLINILYVSYLIFLFTVVPLRLVAFLSFSLSCYEGLGPSFSLFLLINSSADSLLFLHLHPTPLSVPILCSLLSVSFPNLSFILIILLLLLLLLLPLPHPVLPSFIYFLPSPLLYPLSSYVYFASPFPFFPSYSPFLIVSSASSPHLSFIFTIFLRFPSPPPAPSCRFSYFPLRPSEHNRHHKPMLESQSLLLSPLCQSKAVDKIRICFVRVSCPNYGRVPVEDSDLCYPEGNALLVWVQELSGF